MTTQVTTLHFLEKDWERFSFNFFSLLTCGRTLAPNISNGELKIIMMILNDYIYNNNDNKIIIIIPLVTFCIKHKVKQSHISEGNTYKES